MFHPLISDLSTLSKGQAWLNRSANNLDTLKASSGRIEISVREAEGGSVGFRNGNFNRVD
jgi:hypothetical protein